MQKANYRHNKKRNAGFIYAVLIQELTKSIVEKNVFKQKTIKSIIFECYKKNSQLKQELDIYKQFQNIENFSKDQISSLLGFAKSDYNNLNQDKLNEEKNHLIYKVNKFAGQDIYNNFVPNYRFLATLDQIFSNKLSAKNRVLLEAKLLEDIENNRENLVTMPSIDNLTFKTFVEKFNDKYSSLLKEQKDLLINYVLSLEQNNLGFKFFLNEELSRMRKIIMEAKEDEKNTAILNNREQLLEKINEFKTVEISQEMLTNILKIQELVNMLCQSE